MNLSVPVDDTIELVDKTELSPFVDKCVIKVCYVGEQPNRNHTVITKEVAWEMGRKILGSPIVGFFNEQNQDFEGHNRDIKIGDGKFKIVDTTKPYGFVPTDARVWFQKFNDGGTEHEYLCTEGLLWTKAYSEAARILKQGNNQSMEINPETESGVWTNSLNSGDRIFIYNEALIEKLCILGENVEPCFEGAQIKEHFSFAADAFEDFKARTFALIDQLESALQGGLKSPMEDKNEMTPETQELEAQNPELEYEKKDEEKKDEAPENEEKKEDAPADSDEKKDEEEDKKEEKKYNLDEVTEYQELKTQYDALEAQMAELQGEYSALEATNRELATFKAAAEKKDKEAMIDSFYMLSEEDKKDVVENIDAYSLEDIEAKLSVICVKKKVSFIKEGEEEEKSTPATTFSLEAAAEMGSEDDAPAWIRAVRANKK